MKINFILGTRSNTDILSPMAIAVEYARAQLLAKGIYFYWEVLGGYSDPKNASLLFSHIVQSEAPFLILVDRDIIFSTDKLMKLYQRLEEGYDFISGIYCMRNGMRLAGIPLKDVYNLDGTVQEFKYITSGFTGYSRKLLNSVKEKFDLKLCNKENEDSYYPFCEEKTHGEELFGWDWDFCEKAKQAGFKPYVDTSIQVGHIGEKTYSLQDYFDYQDKAIKEIPISESLITDIKKDFSDFTNLRDEDIEHYMKIYNTTMQVNLDWLSNPTSEFYKDNIPFLCGLIIYSSKKITWETRYKPLEHLEGLKIFELGCGIGTLAFWLSEKNDVTGYDISDKGIDFCNFRRDKRGYKTKFVKEMPQDLKDFDVVTATDVLEHIVELGVFLKELGSKMRVGSSLYHYDSFKDIDNFLHHDHSQNIDRYLKDAGFIPISKTWAVKQ